MFSQKHWKASIHKRRWTLLSDGMRTMYAGVAENFAKPLMTCSQMATESAVARRCRQPCRPAARLSVKSRHQDRSNGGPRQEA